jgi:ATP-binding cassette subfamily F protein uup
VSESEGSRRKLSYNEQRELEDLPQRIAALEDEQRRLREESESSDFYKESADHIRGVLERLEQVGQELDTALSRWILLEEVRSG